MKTAIMQPYFLPYIGYWQLISSVDLFVIYDNIQYTKKGWFNRNNMLMNGKSTLFSIPLKKGSDYLDVRDRQIAEDRKPIAKILNQLKAAYSKAEFFEETFPHVQLHFEDASANLFEFLHSSVKRMMDFTGIKTKMIVSSDVDVDHSLKSQDKVIAICKAVGTTMYINPAGGKLLYDSRVFAENGLQLSFLNPGITPYRQFGNDFVSHLSIIDVLMFNGKKRTSEMLAGYELSD